MESKTPYYRPILPKPPDRDPLEILDIPVKVEILDEEEDGNKKTNYLNRLN